LPAFLFGVTCAGALASGSFYANRLTGFPKTVDIAEGEGVECARLVDLQRSINPVMRVNGAFVWPVHAFAVRGELEVPHLVAEFVPLRVEEHGNPANVVFCGVGVGDPLPRLTLISNISSALTSSGASITGTCFSFFQSAF
jgi:hypothetical protein